MYKLCFIRIIEMASLFIYLGFTVKSFYKAFDGILFEIRGPIYKEPNPKSKHMFQVYNNDSVKIAAMHCCIFFVDLDTAFNH